MRPGWSTTRSCLERSPPPARRIASHDIGGDRTKCCCNGRTYIEVAGDREDRKHRPNREQRQGEAAQADHAYGVKDVEGNERQCDQGGDGSARKRRRQIQQEQVKRRKIPQRRKSAEVIVRGLHAAVREIERA